MIVVGVAVVAAGGWIAWKQMQAADEGWIAQIYGQAMLGGDVKPCEEPTFGKVKSMASRGNGKAAFIVGGCYEEGRSVPADMKEAERWFTIAAQRGEHYGILSLDWIAKFREHMSAAKRGEKSDQAYVGEAYERGKGIRKDQVEAQKWFILAGDACAGLECAPDHRKDLVAVLTPSQEADAEGRAKSWRPNQ
jgi:TPR repeat protein